MSVFLSMCINNDKLNQDHTGSSGLIYMLHNARGIQRTVEIVDENIKFG